MSDGFHCPKCALPVWRDGKLWKCASGGLEFAAGTGRAMGERFAHPMGEGPFEPKPMAIGVWYCPMCASRLGPSYGCATCGASLREYVFKLVEFHPHADGKGGFI